MHNTSIPRDLELLKFSSGAANYSHTVTLLMHRADSLLARNRR